MTQAGPRALETRKQVQDGTSEMNSETKAYTIGVGVAMTAEVTEKPRRRAAPIS